MIKYIILGLLQGMTEFLPVSSSGHLVIMQRLLGLHGQAVALTVVLHLGTLLALAVFFFKDLWGLLRNPKAVFYLAVVTVITAAIGFSGKVFFEALFTSSKLVALALMVTGIMLLATKRFVSGNRASVSLKDAVILGFTQAAAIVPGISRAGATISTLLLRGIKPEEAFRFSFLAAMPVILGAALLESKDINLAFSIDSAGLAVGFISSFAAGLISLRFLKVVLKKAKLHCFGYYCIAVAIATLLLLR